MTPDAKKVLIVDDDMDAIEFVSTIMEEAGYAVVTAADGAEGIDLARAESPDLIILDVQMPVKDGFETFAEMRQDDALKAVPVIMLTGVAARTGLKFSSDSMKEFLGEEPNAYVEKPVDPDKLTETVAGLLA